MAIEATPLWRATRSLSPISWPTLPARWAPIAAALTGVHRSQPALVTAPVLESLPASAAAAFSATALARVPPNHADRPTSCRARERVRRAIRVLLGTGTGPPPTPAHRRHADCAQPICVEPARRSGVAQPRPLPGLRRLDLPVLRRRGGHQRVQQAGRHRGHLLDGAVERLGVGPRGLRRPADLADVLQRRGVHLVEGGGRLEVAQRTDVPAHTRSVGGPSCPEKRPAPDSGCCPGPGGSSSGVETGAVDLA